MFYANAIRHGSPDFTSSDSHLSEPQRRSLDAARALYEVPLPLDRMDHHSENQARVAAAIDAFFAAQPGVVLPQDRPAVLARELYRVLRQAGFNPDVYLPRNPAEAHGYGKYLLFTDLNDGAPFCLQVFAFGGDQKTPIHDHPCECTSVVVKGVLRERLYRPLPDGGAFKYAKRHRPTGSAESLHPGGPNIRSIKNVSSSQGAVSVHLYRLDGVGVPAAVKEVYQRQVTDVAVSPLRGA